MKYIFSILLCAILQTGFSQIIKTVGYSYTNGTPSYTPAKAGSALALDTVTWRYYTWNGSTWLSDGFRVQTISGCAAPAYTPTKFQSYLVINACTAGQGGPELYFWTGLVWLQINEGQTYTAGTGIAISGSNEISNTAPDQTVLLNEGAGIDVTGTYPNFTLASTITQGLTSLNGQTGPTQTFATGTTGTDFSISSTTNTHTFNLPSASAANRGALTSADWSVFNSKIGGSGTTNYLPKFTASGTIGNSSIYENSGTVIGGLTSTSGRLRVDDNGCTGNYVFNVRADDQNPWIAGFFNTSYSSSIPGFEYFIFNNGAFQMGTGASGKQIDIYQGYGNTRMTVLASGDVTVAQKLGVGGNPASQLDITGANGYTQLRLRTTYTPTSTADALGNTGDTAWDTNYFYIKTAAGWKRTALSTF